MLNIKIIGKGFFKMTKYDDASWHYSGDYPKELPPKNGGTHIAMFLMWAIEKGLSSGRLNSENEAAIKKLKRKEINYLDFFFDTCDEKLTDEDLSERGNDFAGNYFEKTFLRDYGNVFKNNGAGLYYVEPSWENYKKLVPRLNERFKEWIDTGKWVDPPASAVQSSGRSGLQVKTKRYWVIAGLLAVSAFLIWIGLNGWKIFDLPSQYLGYLFLTYGIAGLCGANIFRGGPFDKRKDPKA